MYIMKKYLRIYICLYDPNDLIGQWQSVKLLKRFCWSDSDRV